MRVENISISTETTIRNPILDAILKSTPFYYLRRPKRNMLLDAK